MLTVDPKPIGDHSVSKDGYPSGWCAVDGSAEIGDGWVYFCFVAHDDGDVRKNDHFLVHKADGIYCEIDWSPYDHMTGDQVRRWLALGRPRRITAGPLREEDLLQLEMEESLNIKFGALQWSSLALSFHPLRWRNHKRIEPIVPYIIDKRFGPFQVTIWRNPTREELREAGRKQHG